MEQKPSHQYTLADYHHWFNPAIEGVFLIDDEGAIVEANPCACDLFGYTYDELRACTIFDLIARADQKANPVSLQRLTVDRVDIQERVLTRKDGSQFIAEIQGRRLPDGLFMGIVRDVSAQHTAAEALRKVQDRYRQVVELANVGIWSMDQHHITTYVNTKMAVMLGYEPVEMVGHKVEDFMFPEDLTAHVGRMKTRHQGGGAIYEHRFIRKDGATLWTVVTATAETDENGNFTGSFGIFTDITAQKRAEIIQSARLHLMDFAISCSLHQLLVETLDTLCALTRSQIGFYHFLEVDQKTISLQAWSTRTVQEFCTAEGEGLHYDLDKAGVWADCVRQRRPIIHNDYAALPNRKGMPPGHAPVQRELCVPVLRSGQIVAMLGVGNKPEAYDLADVELVSTLADLAWDIIERKRMVDALHESETRAQMKMKAIREADISTTELELADIIDVEALQSLMDEFYAITQIPIGILDMQGKVLVARGWQEICTQYHRVHPVTLQNCIESDTILTQAARLGEHRVYRCKNNMIDICSPIIMGGRHMGNIFLGQFFYEDEPPNEAYFRQQARLYGFDEDAYMAALAKAPRWSRTMVDAVMRFYTQLSTLVSSLSFSNLRLARALAEKEILLADLRKSEALLNETQRLTQVGGWEYDVAAQTMTWSDEVYRLHGITDEERSRNPDAGFIIRRSLSCYPPEDRREVSDAFERCVRSGEPYELEVRFVDMTGQHKWVKTIGSPVIEAGRVVRVTGNIMDITASKTLEESLQASLREKDVLLMEVHHRVKNNLAAIHSLLEMERHAVSDPQANTILLELGNRIKSIAVVHETLYGSQSLSKISFQAYLQSFLHHLRLAYPLMQSLETYIDAGSIHLGVDVAVPCGLVVNELVTNALKHAFPPGRPTSDGKPPRIEIHMACADNQYSLTVADNGVGLPCELDLAGARSLGLRLVRMIGENQLGGRVDLDRSCGVCFTLTFPA